MKEKEIISRVARDMFLEQLKWSPWFIGIMLIVHGMLLFLPIGLSFQVNEFFGFSYFSTLIYMLVIGIIAGSTFLPYYVKHGVSRKDFYIGSVIAAVLMVLSVTAIIGILSILEGGILSVLGMKLSSGGFHRTVGGNGILLFFPYVLNSLVYYFVGFFIYLGFYRFKWMVGLGFCAFSVLIVSANDYIWNIGFIGILGEIFGNTIATSLNLAVIGTIILLGILLVLIRLLTKRISIKI